MEKRHGRLAHGYEIRVERTDQSCPGYGLAWGIEAELPQDWDQFQQENVGNPVIRGAQIYRSSERRRWMQNRRVIDEFTNSTE